jgi:hypothetical protein
VPPCLIVTGVSLTVWGVDLLSPWSWLQSHLALVPEYGFLLTW